MNTAGLQRRFLAHLRHPSPGNQPPGFAPERLAVYVDLLYNKFDESLSACFPVLQSILEAAQWRALVQDFIAEHRCLSPYYRQIPDEFVLYLQNERQVASDPPFLAELAHFEWIELVLSISDAEPYDIALLSDEQLLDAVLHFTPVMRLLHYIWPVQEINRILQPSELPATATHILGFRAADEEVRFIALNAITGRFILLLQGGLNGRQALHYLHKELLSTADFSHFFQFGLGILRDLYAQGVIIGTQPLNPINRKRS